MWKIQNTYRKLESDRYTGWPIRDVSVSVYMLSDVHWCENYFFFLRLRFRFALFSSHIGEIHLLKLLEMQQYRKKNFKNMHKVKLKMSRKKK